MTTDRHCLDAETVAAWMDGGLDAAGVAAAEAHASTCERCQALLATVIKTLPTEDPLAPRHEARGTISFWKWFAPLAATAAAVTIWMVVPQTPMQRPPASESAREMADALKKAQAPAAPAEATAQAQPPASMPPEALANSRRNVPAAENEAKNKLADARADAAKADAIGRKDTPGFAPDPSGAPMRDQQGKREENTARAAEMRQVVEAPAPAAAAERMREAPAAPSIGAVRQLQTQVSTPTVVSPDPNSRWRVLAGGTIERSEDAGRTWIAVRVAPKEDVLAGASPGRLVAWMVGRGGLVLLATDGTNFTRLPFPQSVDLVAVSSPELRIAIVTTADGRTFRTDDAGRTWRNP